MKDRYPLSQYAKRSGTGWVDHCPAHDDKNPSLSIDLGRDGQLLLRCHAGCSFEAIIAAAGLKGVPPTATLSPAARLAYDLVADAERRQRVARATKIWREGGPIKGTLSQTYLESRGITWQSEAQRHHPALFHGPSQKLLPALVSCIVRDNHLVGVHRTFLDLKGQKVDRMMLGECRGGAVPLLSNGGRLYVAEGIETAMSIRQLRADAADSSIWAACSAGGMENLQLDGQPREIVVAADGDPVGKRAAENLADRTARQGWTAYTMTAPTSKDWNDVLREEIQHAD